MPRVSVIIPTYNRAELVCTAVKSVLAQNYRDLEIIVVDDGSSDDTMARLSAFPSAVRSFRIAHGGRSRARNYGLKRATGEYIAFLDSDDQYLPCTTETQVTHLENHRDYGMVYASAFNIDDQGRYIYPGRDGRWAYSSELLDLPLFYEATKSGDLYFDIALYIPLTILLPTVMVRREIMDRVGGFDERMERFEDSDMWRRVSKVTKILAIPKPLCKVLAHSGNRLRSPAVEFKSVDYYVRKVLREDWRRGYLRLHRLGAKLYFHYGMAVRSSTSGSWGYFQRFNLQAALLWPFCRAYWVFTLPKCLLYQAPVAYPFVVALYRKAKSTARALHSTQKDMAAKYAKKVFRFAKRTAVKEKNWPAVAPLVLEMARTGKGTDECLKLGCLPMLVHFYSPVPDIQALEARNVWDRRSTLAGVDFQPEAQVAYLLELGRAYGHECDWPAKLRAGEEGFFTENDCFSFGCAAALHSIVRSSKPKHVIEVGSGNSSRIIAAALAMNRAEGFLCEYTVIDPYPGEFVAHGGAGAGRIIRQGVETASPEVFATLTGGDLLFIDSGHTVRTGSDVNFLFLDVLPNLAPGVMVHIHDIHLPFEYHKIYATNPAFRVFWTEQYLLQAFLACNKEFEILLGMCYLMADHLDVFRQAFPKYDPVRHRLTSGSFWMRRRLAPER